MERARRLRDLWNWLPVFRAVAETEHLPSAAEALLISPASLSRSIGLLEEDLGQKLFDRVGRGLQLNRAGVTLLAAVRDGMRVIDDGVVRVEGKEWSGEVVLWAPLVYAELYLLPLASRLSKEHPTLRPVLQSQHAEQLAEKILRGQVDLALTETPPTHPHLTAEVFLDLHYGVYCSENHALRTSPTLTISDLLRQSFAVPPLENTGYPSRWPAEFPRLHLIVVETMSLALAACRLGQLAILPDVVACTDKTLARLPIELFAPLTLYKVYRRPLGTSNHLTELLGALEETK